MIPHLAADGTRLALHRRGQGAPVFFQHGLGGDHLQTFESFPDLPGWQLNTLECRAHGASESTDPLSIAGFAADVAGAMPEGAVLGGISMGAAISARLAVLQPARLRALVLVRPAWFDSPAPANMASIAEVAAMIARGETAADFAATPTHARLAATAPDNLSSLNGFFAREPLALTARLLGTIAADGPGITRAEITAIRLPTLVCGCAEDEIHPLSLARDWAATIPGARFVDLPPKGRDKPAHLAALHAAIAQFLKEIR
jgi:pimeloyl-ACP methyl ester carboxylesterase